MRRPAVRDVGSLVAGRVIALVASVAVSVLTARVLGPGDKGLLSLAVLAVFQLTVIFSVGADVAVVYLVGRRTVPMDVLASVAGRLTLGAGVIGCLVAIGAEVVIFDGSSAGPLVAALALALSLPLGALTGVWLAVLRSTGRLVEASVVDSVSSVVLVVFVAGSLASGFGLTGALAAYSTSVVVTHLTTRVLARRANVPTGLARWDRSTGGSLIRFGLRGHVGTVLQSLNYRLDIFLVGAIAGIGSAGVYAVAISVAEVLWLIPNSAGPFLLQRSATSDPNESASVARVVTRVTSAIVLVAGAGLALAAPWLIPAVFGDEFDRAAKTVLTLLPGVWAISIWKVLVNDISGRGYPQVKSFSAGVGLVLSLVLDLLLIPPFGVVGAALASSVAYLAMTATVLQSYRRLVPTDLRSLLVPKRADFGGLLQRVRAAGRRSS